jgi:TetR/AcrR family transcriptional regulator, transcriptional repressor for nem operon
MKTKGEMSKAKILEVARGLFRAKGFNATTISDLVDATGMQKGSLYFHFSSKEAIALEVLKEETESYILFLKKSLNAENGGQAIDTYFSSVLDKHKSRGFIGGCLFGNTALEMSDNDPLMAGEINKVFDEWTEIVAKAVTKAQQSNQIRADMSNEVLARHIVATIEGGIMMSRLKKDQSPLKECLDALRLTLGLRV